MSNRLVELARAIDACLASDRPRLRGRLRSIAAGGEDVAGDASLDRLASEVAASAERRRRRTAERPTPTFPDELPVAQRREEIAAAIREHQVVVVCGETGSGKTTQLPKICLALGRGVDGMIGHTQPRRVAARSVAARIARELGVRLPGSARRETPAPVGDRDESARSIRAASRDATRAIVGCAVRFDDRTGPDTAIKLMTDGILLAETQRDRLLRQYDTIIVDEAHERSLNIDFLLGYLRQLLPRRPDLKVVITSATIDPRRFSDHFGEAPIIEVSGRMYPVEVRWRPVEARDGEDEDRALARATLDAVEEAMELDRERSLPPGDVLVFQSGEREIAETSEALRGRVGPDVEILPLFARLSSEDQDRVFQSPASRAGRRRIVLATNIAETSLTVPGIRYVVDPGFARISRFGTRTKVQRLPIEPISQASADQRKGRCGRTESGVCLRLYSEADHAARPRYTDPEILRTNLAAVILQMKTLRLGAIEQFPFIDPPSARAIASGEETLRELGALDADGSLTALGSELASYPIDPRLARMLIEARSEGCLAEMLVVAAALAVQDPRVRPSDRSGDADLAHLRFRDEQSDFVGLVKLWDAWRMKNDEVQRGEISGNALRRWARDSFLSYVRLREWQDVHRQLVRVMSKAATSAPRAGRRQWRRRT